MSGDSDDTCQVVVFGLGEERFALPVTSVREILDHRRGFRLPDAPPWLLGLIDVRGHGLPLVDLRRRLGMTAADPTPATRILIVDLEDEAEALSVGFVVDRVIDVSSVPPGLVEPAPDIGGRWRSDHIDGIVRRDDGFIVLLSIIALRDDSIPAGTNHELAYAA